MTELNQECPLFDDFEAKFLDDGVCEHFFGDALGLRLRIFARETVETQNEEFALADVFDGVEAKARESVLNRLTLGIKNGALGHDPYVCLHAEIIALRRESETWRPATRNRVSFKRLRSFGHLRGCSQDDSGLRVVGFGAEAKA